MNKKAQANEIMAYFSMLVGLILVIGFLSSLPSILNPCTQEKADRDRYKADLDLCLSQIKNQTELTNDLNRQCEDRIANATQQCSDDLLINIGIINAYRFMFLTYHLSLGIALLFGFNLFKGFLRFEIKTSNGKLVVLFKGIRIVWTGLKWIIFVGSILIFLFALAYLFFPFWFS